MPDGVPARKSDGRRKRGQRTGFSTGACSAAAARAATLGLIGGVVPETVICRLPNKSEVMFQIIDGKVSGDSIGRQAHAVVIKDGGDDPDATHGARITVDVCKLPGRRGEVMLCGGHGVGTVTREGLGLVVGGPAINPTPRKNIRENVLAVAGALLETDGLEVTISVPDGEARAKKTLNARLGILGGISILGTTGIVRPYSTAAFRASVVQSIKVAEHHGQTGVVLTTGGRTEKFAMRQLPQLAEICFVQMGDFVKSAFQAAISHGMRHIYVGAMVGKLSKMGQGLPVTHARRGRLDREAVSAVAAAVGAPPELVAEISAAETARFAAEKLALIGLADVFYQRLAMRARDSLRTCYPGDYRLTILVCDGDGKFICRIEEEDAAND